MFSTLRTRFGIPGAISVIALVFAMLGGAYAASSHSDGKATASKAGKRGPRGPKGATGPAGPAGPAGPQGQAGANGSDGESVVGTKFTGEKGGCKEGGIEFESASGVAFACNGAKGTSVTGTAFSGNEHGCVEGGVEFAAGTNKTFACNGAKGTSVTSTEFSGTEGPCKEGGSKFVGSGTTYACNGSPWAAGGILPSGQTETGAWSTPMVRQNFSELEPYLVPISFSLPLSSSLASSKVHYVKSGETATGDCSGGTAAAPKAAQGSLCVYAGHEGPTPAPAVEEVNFLNPTTQGVILGAGKTGTVMRLFIEESKHSGEAIGTWAVTAP